MFRNKFELFKQSYLLLGLWLVINVSLSSLSYHSQSYLQEVAVFAVKCLKCAHCLHKMQKAVY